MGQLVDNMENERNKLLKIWTTLTCWQHRKGRRWIDEVVNTQTHLHKIPPPSSPKTTPPKTKTKIKNISHTYIHTCHKDLASQNIHLHTGHWYVTKTDRETEILDKIVASQNINLYTGHTILTCIKGHTILAHWTQNTHLHTGHRIHTCTWDIRYSHIGQRIHTCIWDTVPVLTCTYNIA